MYPDPVVRVLTVYFLQLFFQLDEGVLLFQNGIYFQSCCQVVSLQLDILQLFIFIDFPDHSEVD
jgi:hypothetical protein